MCTERVALTVTLRSPSSAPVTPVADVTGNGLTSYFVIVAVVRFGLGSVTTYWLKEDGVNTCKINLHGNAKHLDEPGNKPILVYGMVCLCRHNTQRNVVWLPISEDRDERSEVDEICWEVDSAVRCDGPPGRRYDPSREDHSIPGPCLSRPLDDGGFMS